MRIKSKDIARALNISEATVSLALNNRGGVKTETKQRIYDYIAGLETVRIPPAGPDCTVKKGTLLMINYKKHGAIVTRSQKTEPVLQAIEQAVRQAGYGFEFFVFDEKNDHLDTLMAKCRKQDVKGLYIMAAEMVPGDMYPFLQLRIPVAAGDNLFSDMGVDCFLVDNREGIRHCVDFLIDKGHSHIIYLAETVDIYNFTERRDEFVLEMARRDCGDASNRIWYLGSTVQDICASMMKHLDEGLKKTTAFILESSMISLGVSKALLERKIRIPRDISLVGFDALPPDSLLGLELTLIKGTHTKRHLAAIKYLLRHIEEHEDEVVSIYYKTRRLDGDSVFDKTKYIYH